MNYIILAAGKGTRLHPYTRNYPKSMLKLANGKTVLQRTIDCINKFDRSANITTVVGFNKNEICNNITGCNFIENPFWNITNSIASLWFAQDLLKEDLTIINADIVFSEELWETVINTNIDAFVCLDSSIKSNGDYNVQTLDDKVIVMSKDLNQYFGEYAGVTKLNKENANILRKEIIKMVNDGFYNEWYENAVVQTILNNQMTVKYIDIKDYQWAELDTINDLFLSRKITSIEVNGGTQCKNMH